MKKQRLQIRKTSGTPAEKTTASSEISSFPNSHCTTILESVREGVFAVDLDKKITYFNPAAEDIMGFKALEVIGKRCHDIFQADVCDTGCPMDDIFSRRDRQLNSHTSIISKSGRHKSVSLVTCALINKNDKVIGGLEIFCDLSELEELRKGLARRFTSNDIVGRHPRIQEILSFLPDIAHSESPVFIEGPTGSGKELIARAVHSLSPRKKGPFIAVNCSALPDTLLESELFGYAKGAFTGAMRKKPGRFLLANHGTLFLDEIANTSPMLQAELLRVLEDGEFTPLGDTRAIKVDFRIVSATNLDLKQLVQENEFREDLYYRLNVAKISLPSLKERKEDIPLLIDHFIHKFNLLKGKAIKGITSELLSFFMDYSFPGNIRELENIIEYAFIACKDGMIGMEHLPRDLFDEIKRQWVGMSNVLIPFTSKEVEKIRIMIDVRGYSREETARALGISRTTLWRKIKKMKKYGLIK